MTPVAIDRKSTRLNSSHTEIYTLSLHDALPIYRDGIAEFPRSRELLGAAEDLARWGHVIEIDDASRDRSEEHTSELQSHRDLHSFPTRRSSDLSRRHRRVPPKSRAPGRCRRSRSVGACNRNR